MFAFLHVALIGVTEKFPAPTPKRGIKPRPHIKGTLGIKHPLEALADDTGRSQWNEMTGHHHASVFIRTSGFARGVTIENSNLTPGLGEIPTATEANDAAANDEYFL